MRLCKKCYAEWLLCQKCKQDNYVTTVIEQEVVK